MRALIAAAVALAACRGAEPPSGPIASGSAPAAPAPIVDAGVIDAAPPADAAATVPCTPDDTNAVEGSTAPRDTLGLTAAKFADLPGWADDHLGEAVPSFLRSCDKLRELADDAAVGTDGHGGKARQWRKACAAAARLKPGDDAAARAMFEAEFVPYVAAGAAGPVGKLTGFYVAEIHASKTKHGKYQTPVLGRPDDLVMVDLGTYIKDGHGRRIWGRMDHGELVPYFTRAEIRKGALARRGLELMYVDDPVDLLFAQIEGSAKAVLDDGSVVWLEFAGKNGRAYKGVGGVLRGGGFLKPGEGTMQGIRQWFHDHPTRYDEIADQDASYVFFMPSKIAGAIGSQKTVLTARRSMAVDRTFIAMSTPVWVEAHAPVPGQKGVTELWHHLLIAQDTGGGIVGAVRGDIYWGDDAAAAELGGRMGGPGRYWLLLPRGVTK
ncbi:MAG TPA: MltA domain-containing protein [Kofleriaceae bacterium]|nr:MltA domain-containing protein [Kofleriaceae bacterium]